GQGDLEEVTRGEGGQRVVRTLERGDRRGAGALVAHRARAHDGGLRQTGGRSIGQGRARDGARAVVRDPDRVGGRATCVDRGDPVGLGDLEVGPLADRVGVGGGVVGGGRVGRGRGHRGDVGDAAGRRGDVGGDGDLVEVTGGEGGQGVARLELGDGRGRRQGALPGGG